MRQWTAAAVLCLALGALAPPGASAQALPFVIVVNPSNPSEAITVVELRHIFMKQTRMWPHGEAMVPVDWVAESDVRKAFSERILNRSVREMAEFWVQQTVTRGLTPPPTQRSARAVRRFVASVRGAISYLPPDDVDDTVKVIRLAER